VIDTYPGRMLCGEVQGKTDRIGHFYGNDRPRLHLPLNFALLDSEWSALGLQATIDAYYNALPEGAWPVWVVGGHDKHRVASTIGQAQARVLAVLLLTLWGTPIFYMGDELGMERVEIPRERITDPFAKLVKGYDLGRDPERAPLRWDDSAGGGFTTGDPWLPLGDAQRNVAALRADEPSLLNLYRELIALRRRSPCLRAGAYHPLRARNDVLAFRRVLGEDEMMVLLNIAPEPRKWDWQGRGRCLLSTRAGRSDQTIEDAIQLHGNEAVVLAVYSRNA
jgi:alpha-glucosidase